jgi:hypothetical protein
MVKNKRLPGKVDKPASPAVARQRSREQLYAQRKAIRDTCPRTNHADWKPPADRPDPIEILEASKKGRLPELIPVRYGRMIPSPFVFFRGAAAIMAADLAHTPATGIRVQVCGDAHLMNFGVFATPERRVIFDINDFDETLPAPWEWDVKRLATSFLIASRSNGFSESAARKTALCCVRSYRERMAEFAQMRTLEVWYARLDLETILPSIKDQEAHKRLQRRVQKAEASDVLEGDFPKLVSVENGQPKIREKGITEGGSIQEVSSLGTRPESIIPRSTNLLANSVADPDSSMNLYLQAEAVRESTSWDLHHPQSRPGA